MAWSSIPVTRDDSAEAASSAEASWKRIVLPNESFEEGKMLPAGWRALQGNTNYRSAATIMAWDILTARTGQRSLYIRRGGNGPLRWSIASSIPVTPGKRYQLRAWFRFMPAAGNEAGLSVLSRRRVESLGRLWDSGKIIEPDQNMPGQWQQGVFEFTPMEGVNEVWLRLSDHNHWPYRSGGPREIWIDDVSLWVAQD